MYTRILVPLDGSKAAEKVLPYARFLGSKSKLPVELLAVVDVVEIGLHVTPEKAHLLTSIIESTIQRSEQYLRKIAETFSDAEVTCTVVKGVAPEVIIDKAAQDKGTLISMASHGRSGLDRWLLGSVTEKVLRGASNPVLVYRAAGEEKPDGYAYLRTITVPLDGSELAETVLPPVTELAKKLEAEVILFRAYHIPYTAVVPAEGYYPPIDYELIESFREEALSYLEKKAETIKQMGVTNVKCLAKEGFAADQIIALARETPDNLIAMCTHGRSGIKRWVLGSVTETVVRHSDDPVLVIRAQDEVRVAERAVSSEEVGRSPVLTPAV
jgi:nucleotide-binding universal stress UspA family protein